jgi:glycosyltransferase involved in cell wall biosynthesis
MKIAYITTEFPPRIYGGLGVYVDAISRELASMGEKISVVTMGDAELKRREAFKGIEVLREIPLPLGDGLEIFFSPQTLAWGEGMAFLLDFLSFNQLAASRLRDAGPFDLCVAQDWLGLPGAMALKRSGVPMIYHVHGLELGRSENPNLQLVSLERKGASLADAVITVSHAMKEELAGMGVPEEKIHVCHHGIDAKIYDPGRIRKSRLGRLRSSYGLSQEDQVLLFVGRLEPVKGVLQLLQAMPSVLEKHPRVKLLVVGKGSLEDRVRSEAEKLGVKLIPEFLDPDAKAYHYALADLCLFPSLYEPFGIVALEAGAMERPSIVGASGTSGLREIVENPSSPRPTGIHVNPRDPGDIAWGIDLALEDPARLRAWGRNARERVQNLFTMKRAAELTLDIYREVAQSLS